MKKTLLILSVIIALGIGTDSVHSGKLSLSYSTMDNCEGEKFINEKKYPQLLRTACFEKSRVFYYNICESSLDCETAGTLNLTGEPLGNEEDNPYAVFLSDSVLLLLVRYIEKLEDLSLGELLVVKDKLEELKVIYADQPSYITSTNYLLYEVVNFIALKELFNNVCGIGGEC